MTAIADAEALVARYIEEVWNQGDLASLDALTAPGFEYRLGGQPPRDRAAFAEFLAQTRTAFPDWRVEPDHIIADPEGVAVRWHARATHRGRFHGILPTGRTIRVTGINLYAIEQGRIASEWEETDTLAILQQLGVPF